jgi:outer membrane protein TolC
MKNLLHTVLATISAILFTTATALAGSPGHTTLVLDLNECIRTALQSAPEIGEIQADLALTRSKLEEAKSHRYPQVDVMSLFGPAPGAKKEDLTPVNTSKAFSLKDMTWFASTDLLLTQPLWTFGKISENMKAATHGIEVDKAKKQQKGNEIVLEVKKYYYGTLLARELQAVISELQLYLQQGKQKVQQLIDNESVSGDPMDLYKIEAYSGEINKYMEEALKGERLATAALKARLGLTDTVDITVSSERLEMPDDTLPELSGAVEKARLHRPEFRQLAEGILARTALVEASRGNYYPDLFLAGMLSWAYADKRDRIQNPYISDSFQHAYGGVALGLKWKLDFGITSARVAAEQAHLNRLTSTKQYADNYIPLQVQKAWLEMQEAQKNVFITLNAYQSAKKWGTAALANFDFGIGNPRDVFDAVGVYGKMKAAHHQALFDYQMAKASLEYAIGESPLLAQK